MSDPEHVDRARRWLRFAMEDLDVAQCLLATDGSRPRPGSAGVSLTCAASIRPRKRTIEGRISNVHF